MAVPFRRANLDLQYGEMIKDTSARLYVVPLEQPLVIQTTPVIIKTSLEDPSVPFVYLDTRGDLGTFFKDAENAIADACVANKHRWFKVKVDDDDVLRRGFKTFFSDSGFKVKVPDTLACFDAAKNPIGREDIPAGTAIRAVLELTRLCFGRHEYGATWKMLQVQVVDTTCLIADDPVAPEESVLDPGESDSDLDEFL